MIGFKTYPAPTHQQQSMYFMSVDVNGNTLTTTTPTTFLTKLFLSKRYYPAGYLLVNYSPITGISNFKGMDGMGLQTINGLNQNDVVDLGTVKHIIS